MDLVCTRCGEPWETDHVIHEDPAAFERKDLAIITCPSCQGKEVQLDEAMRMRLAVARDIAALFGADIDGYASELETLGLA